MGNRSGYLGLDGSFRCIPRRSSGQRFHPSSAPSVATSAVRGMAGGCAPRSLRPPPHALSRREAPRAAAAAGCPPKQQVQRRGLLSAATLLLLARAPSPAPAAAALGGGEQSIEAKLQSDVVAVEELIGVQTILLGLCAAALFRLVAGRGAGVSVAAGAPAVSLSATGARRSVDVTPRTDALLNQLLSPGVSPDSPVSSVMATDVLTARTTDLVSSLAPVLARITGVVVLTPDAPGGGGGGGGGGQVVGVFSRRDAEKARPGDAVALWMSSPALTILPSTSVGECAALMLRYEVHRLPVVDPATGGLAGLVTRSDVFTALLSRYANTEECRVVSFPPPDADAAGGGGGGAAP